jgi:hypothetical protein
MDSAEGPTDSSGSGRVYARYEALMRLKLSPLMVADGGAGTGTGKAPRASKPNIPFVAIEDEERATSLDVRGWRGGLAEGGADMGDGMSEI